MLLCLNVNVEVPKHIAVTFNRTKDDALLSRFEFLAATFLLFVTCSSAKPNFGISPLRFV